jgi:inorganic triphosphatase YgiF
MVPATKEKVHGDGMPIETELKLQLPPMLHGVDSHQLLTRLKPNLRSRGVKKILRNVYFDTAERDLAKRGMALRVREIGGKRIQTLKVPNSGALGLQTYRELEAELPSDMPSLAKVSDRTLARELRGEVWPRLQPVFFTNFERSWTLPYAVDRVSWDRGSIRAGDREASRAESAQGGDRVDLWGAAEELLDIVPFRLSRRKAARGYALPLLDQQPQKATLVKLSDEDLN